MTRTPPSAYQKDLAWIHDVGFTAAQQAAAPWMLRLLAKRGAKRGLVVDLGCGSGAWAADLCRNGYRVLGVDISASMLRLARGRAPASRFVQGSLFSTLLPACSTVTALGEVVNYLFDRSNSAGKLGAFFCKVYRALDAGGIFLFDAAHPGRARPSYTRQVLGERGDWAIALRVTEDRERILTRRMFVFRRAGRGVRCSEETHRQRLYTRSQIVRLLHRAGFSVRVVKALGPLRFAPGQSGFVCVKR